MSDNIIKVPFGKGKKKDSDKSTKQVAENELPSVLLCAGCGNSLFMILLMNDGDIAPICQHCNLEFGYSPDGSDGILIQEEYEEIGIKPSEED